MKKEINITLPHSWADLSEKELIWIADILRLQDKEQDYIRLLAFKVLTGLKIVRQTGPGEYFCRLKGHKILLDSWQIDYHCKKLSWITDTPIGVKPLSVLADRKPVFQSLEGTPLKLYLAAENYYQAFLYTEDSSFLLRLASVLYSADTLWSDSDTEIEMKRFRACSESSIFTVFLWYSAVKQLLARQYPYLFSPAGSADEGNDSPDMRAHINNILRVLTSGDVTRMEAVLETETWYALNELNEKAREVEEFNAKNHG